MREILFRGKSMYGTWVYGFCVKKADPLYEGVKMYFILRQDRKEHGMLDSLVTWIPVKPDTVGQYTGLTDENGKKIFEGDIIKATTSNVVGEDIDAIVIANLDDYELMYDIEHSHTLEIIGNIHDNPELL